MQLLDDRQISSKIARLAMEILERNTEETELYVIGINNRGLQLANRLVEELLPLSNGSTYRVWPLRIKPADPLNPGPILEGGDVSELTGKAVLIVDDVANTGRTLFYALRPLQEVLPKKIEVAVLVDRRHKSWPIYVTYSGLDLSTTIGDNVLVTFGEGESKAVLE